METFFPLLEDSKDSLKMQVHISELCKLQFLAKLFSHINTNPVISIT